jgi:hypothetical protein
MRCLRTSDDIGTTAKKDAVKKTTSPTSPTNAQNHGFLTIGRRRVGDVISPELAMSSTALKSSTARASSS